VADKPTAAELKALKAGAAKGRAVDDLSARRDSKARGRYRVEWDHDRKPPKPVLPERPSHEDVSGQCSWVTAVLNFDQSHPVVRAKHHGLSGAGGHVILYRLEAPEVRFEPASKIGNTQKLVEEMVWQLLPTDGEPYPWANSQATIIARIVHLLCGADKSATTHTETEHIITTFLEAAKPCEGTTYGTASQRAELAGDLRGESGAYTFGVDDETGEFVIRVSDLQRMAREIVGGSVAYGWLNARMESLGWERVRLDGHKLPKSPATQGVHVRADVYRGFLNGGS
jgi:hypothetical protein